MAAVLACGEGAVLSHHSAAALWELLKPIDGAIHVSLPTTNGRRARSDLEEDFYALLQRHHPRLPLPETNVKIGRWEVDFLWRSHRLIVEIDSYIYHRGSIAFEDDYARDLDLRSAGYTVLPLQRRSDRRRTRTRRLARRCGVEALDARSALTLQAR
jgi:very-short-patch-repair endonuclease